MFRYKTYQKSIFIAVMAILLCLASITGATFALFTDSGDDGKIGVNATAGQLKVDIVDEKDTHSLKNQVLEFVNADGGNEALFEPGAVFRTEGFCIKNDGKVPFNFICYMTRDPDPNLADNFLVDFYDAFDIWITQDLTNRDSAVKLDKFKGYDLGPGDVSDVYYLVFRMKPSAENPFQTRLLTGVGITVYALQKNAVLDK